MRRAADKRAQPCAARDALREETNHMSCWVVPMVAAEMWGVPVEAVLQKARTGEVPSKSENGFMFIDVAPDSPRCDPPAGIRPPRPPTYTTITGDELAALTEEFESEDDLIEVPMPVEDFRVARQLASKLRRPPLAA
jgi:hypothetical protein